MGGTRGCKWGRQFETPGLGPSTSYSDQPRQTLKPLTAKVNNAVCWESLDPRHKPSAQTHLKTKHSPPWHQHTPVNLPPCHTSMSVRGATSQKLEFTWFVTLISVLFKNSSVNHTVILGPVALASTSSFGTVYDMNTWMSIYWHALCHTFCTFIC